jgi:hypothetical protein
MKLDLKLRRNVETKNFVGVLFQNRDRAKTMSETVSIDPSMIINSSSWWQKRTVVCGMFDVV